MPQNKIHIKQIENLQPQLNKSLYDVLSVGNTASNSIFMGTYSVGFNTLTPDANLHVEGTFKYVDGNQSNGYVLVSDSNGLASWTSSSLSAITTATWTVDLVDAQTYDIYAPYDFIMSTYSIIFGSSSTTISFTDDGITYSLGATVSQGSKFNITASVASVWNLNIEV